MAKQEYENQEYPEKLREQYELSPIWLLKLQKLGFTPTDILLIQYFHSKYKKWKFYQSKITKDTKISRSAILKFRKYYKEIFTFTLLNDGQYRNAGFTVNFDKFYKYIEENLNKLVDRDDSENQEIDTHPKGAYPDNTHPKDADTHPKKTDTHNLETNTHPKDASTTNYTTTNTNTNYLGESESIIDQEEEASPREDGVKKKASPLAHPSSSLVLNKIWSNLFISTDPKIKCLILSNEKTNQAALSTIAQYPDNEQQLVYENLNKFDYWCKQIAPEYGLDRIKRSSLPLLANKNIWQLFNNYVVADNEKQKSAEMAEQYLEPIREQNREYWNAWETTSNEEKLNIFNRYRWRKQGKDYLLKNKYPTFIEMLNATDIEDTKQLGGIIHNYSNKGYAFRKDDYKLPEFDDVMLSDEEIEQLMASLKDDED